MKTLRAFQYSLLASILVITSCGQNVYKSVSSNTSDSALYQDAIQKMNAYNWDSALTDFSAMSSSYLADRNVQFQYAQALAGKCGFDFINFFNSLGSANFGTGAGQTPLMLWLMQAYQGKTINMYVSANHPTAANAATNLTYCSWAQQIMDNIQTNYGPWNNSESLFVFVFNMAKMGMILRYFADTNGAGGLGDGNVDGTFNMCQTAIFPDFFAVQLVTSFALIQSTAGSVTGLGSTTTAVSAITTACTTAGIAMCTHTTPSQVTATDIYNISGLALMYSPGNPMNGLGLYSSVSGINFASNPGGNSFWQCNGSNLGAGTFGCCP